MGEDEEKDGEKEKGSKLWPPERRAAFLEAYAATGCVTRAAEAVGARTTQAYDLRIKDAAFAEQWDAARVIGYLQVEERLILELKRGRRKSAGGVDAERADEDEAFEPMSDSDRELALNLLKFHHHGAFGRPHAGGTPPKRTTEAETDESILKRLAAVKKRIGTRGGRDG